MNLKFIFRLALTNSPYTSEDLENLQLPVIREIVYRLISFFLPLLTLPSIILTYSTNEFLLCSILSLLNIIVILSSIWLIKTGKRLISPPMLLGICVILYLSTVLQVQQHSILWSYAFVAAFYMLLEKDHVVAANVLWVVMNAVIVFNMFPLEQTIVYTLSLAGTSFGMEVQSSILYRNEESLKNMALRDPLTNAFNRRALMQELEEAGAVHRRYDTAMSIIMIDIDHFKKINDTYGHNEGDSVLVNFVTTLSGRLRETDKFFRLGGEEFVVLLQSTSIHEAANIAESYCSLIQKATLCHKADITISCGVAQVRQEDTVSGWLNRCDAALYNAKSNGRNRVEVAANF